MANKTKTCSRCRRDLPLTAFAKRAAAHDGLQNYCRECSAAWAEEKRPRKLAPAPPVPDGMKWCRRCGETKPVSDFPANRTTSDGRQTYCRSCFADIYRLRREAEGALVRPSSIPEGHRFCRGCGLVKPDGDFMGRTGRRDRATFRCNECMRERDRRRHLQRTYEMTEADLAALLESQGGLCAICQDAPAIHIDHDHVTGAIRGMLCFRCNAALGQFADDPETLLRAAQYLLMSAEGRWSAELFVRAGLTRFDYGSAS